MPDEAVSPGRQSKSWDNPQAILRTFGNLMA